MTRRINICAGILSYYGFEMYEAKYFFTHLNKCLQKTMSKCYNIPMQEVTITLGAYSKRPVYSWKKN